MNLNSQQMDRSITIYSTAIVRMQTDLMLVKSPDQI